MDTPGDTFPETEAESESITSAILQEWIDGERSVTILDVRDVEAFETWKIEGPNLEIHNRHYTDFIEDGTEAIEAAPMGDPLVVVCAEGKASQYVADRLVAAGRDVVSLEPGMEGWANHYVGTEIEAYDGPGTVIQYHRPATGCLSYLVASAGEAAVIDPLRAFTSRYHEDAAELGVDLHTALDTHCHADHLSGLRPLAEEGVTGIVPEATVDRGMEVTEGIETVVQGSTVDVGDVVIEARNTPGHTSDMTSYLLADRVLLTGDTLFVQSVGRPDLEADADGAPEAARELHESLQERILSLDGELIVAGGHHGTQERPGPDGTFTARLGHLRETLPVLSMDRDAFVEYVLSNVPPRPANYEEIVAINLGHRTVETEEATEIELGPNNCAATGSQG